MNSRLHAILVTILFGATGGAHATVVYSLNATSDFGGGRVRVESFTFLTQGHLAADRLFTVEELEPGCRMGFGDACGSVQFVIDANAAGWGVPAEYSGFAALTAGGVGTYYYFPRYALSTVGTWYSLTNGGVLSVSAVPEPSSLSILLSGGLLVAVARRTSRTTKTPAGAA